MTPRTCAECGREFTPRAKGGKYCSKACARRAASAKARARYRRRCIRLAGVCEGDNGCGVPHYLDPATTRVEWRR